MATYKGILGYRANPKNPILFSFAPRQGEECLSDSEDSDYCPVPSNKYDNKNSISDEVSCGNINSDLKTASVKSCSTFKRENLTAGMAYANSMIVTIKKKKKKHKQKNQSRDETGKKIKKKRKKLTHVDASITEMLAEEENCDVSMDCFPLHVLIEIFTYIVDTNGALPFLCRAARVCKRWHEASIQPRLWRRVDLSFGWILGRETYLNWLCDNRLAQCRDIDLTAWSQLTHSGLLTLTKKCPNLRRMNVSACKNINSKGIQAIADNCSQLEQINVTGISQEGLSKSSLKYMFDKAASRLTHFKTGDCILKGFNSLLSSIATCSNLLHLEVSGVVFSECICINIERLQTGCPKLRVLRFVNARVRFLPSPPIVQARSLGFPDLEELSVTCNADRTTVRASLNGDSISRLLKACTKLQTLDVRGWAFDTFRSLIHVPAARLELLLLANNSMTVTSDFQLDLVMAKFGESLLELDLSWNNYKEEALCSALTTLTESPSGSPLEVLDLTGTIVDYHTVRMIVRTCHHLRALNLSSCRSLPRGMKRAYEGKDMVWLQGFIDSFDRDT